ncbi:PPE domain-containing protein [Mycobacterium sp. Aquia_213]|uniref:PPE domain-containing protein n=1 Tax=Mycobacterium sp. Aquia_213 TaxID=2991728 RepID=UPI002D1E44BD|nr:hypothetical protein [Mycobacterium sp. Aquia_213]
MRAQELGGAMPRWPILQPTAPGQLAMTRNAVTVLQRSADNMRVALKAGEERWVRLAQLLVQAAKAYKDVDQSAASSLTFGASSSPLGRKPTTYQLVPDSSPAYVPPSLPSAGVYEATRASITALDTKFLSVREAAKQIHAGDPNARSLLDFADAWTGYEGALHDAALRFRPFDSWRGKAVTQVEAQFQRHRDWLTQMASSSRTLGQQARDLAFAHYAAASQHPRSAQVDPLYAKLTAKRISSRDYAAYLKMQKLSEDVRTEYRKKAGLPLSPLNLLMPPERADSDLLTTPEEKAQELGRKSQEERLKSQQEAYKPMQELLKQQQEQARIAQEEMRKARQEALEDGRKAREEARIAQQEAQDEADERAQEAQKAMKENLAKSLNAQQALAKSMGKSGMPKLPSPSKLMGAAGQLANMAKGMGPKPTPAAHVPGAPLIPPLPLGGHPPHVAPAASAGAGVSLGGSGIGAPPRLQPPLQPPTPAQPTPTPLQTPRAQIPMDPESVARSAAGPGPHGAGGAGAAPSGGGMGGGAAMGGPGAGQGKGGGTAKRVQPDDPAVYTEERPWTEGVIGRRPRKVDPAPPPADGAK